MVDCVYALDILAVFFIVNTNYICKYDTDLT